jgi:hypothetical protein
VRLGYLLDLPEKWGVGGTSFSCVEVKSDTDAIEDEEWPPDLSKELRQIIGGRRIEVIWRSRNLLQS